MEAHILELEKKYWQAMEDRDYETVKNLTRFPCIVAGKNGVGTVAEPEFRKMFESGAGSQYKVVEISSSQSQMIGGNTAIIAYQIQIDASGKIMNCACASTWINNGSDWKCALHTESELAEKTAK